MIRTPLLEENEQPTEERVIYPLMCMVSLEPMRVKKTLTIPFGFFNQTFSLHFTALKKEQEGPLNLTYILTSTNSLLPPEYIYNIVDNENTEEAKDFLLKPLVNLEPFKKAIILFEKKPYTLAEFEQVMIDWKKDLEEKIK